MKLALALAAGLAAAGAARADSQADFYAGAAHTPRSDMTLVVSTPGGSADHEFHQVRWRNSLEVGIRATRWADRAPWYGIGLDFANFSADIPTQVVDTTIQGSTAPATLGGIDITVYMLGLDLVRLRYPSALSPYITAGPALFRIKATNRGNGELTNRSVIDNAIGYKIGAGLSWTLRKDVSFFGEFRYTHVRAEPVFDSALSSSRIPLRFDLDTHHLVGGLSLAF